MLILSKDLVNAKAVALCEYDEVSQEEFEVTESAIVKDILYAYHDIIFYCLCLLFLWL